MSLKDLASVHAKSIVESDGGETVSFVLEDGATAISYRALVDRDSMDVKTHARAPARSVLISLHHDSLGVDGPAEVKQGETKITCEFEDGVAREFRVTKAIGPADGLFRLEAVLSG